MTRWKQWDRETYGYLYKEEVLEEHDCEVVSKERYDYTNMSSSEAVLKIFKSRGTHGLFAEAPEHVRVQVKINYTAAPVQC